MAHSDTPLKSKEKDCKLCDLHKSCKFSNKIQGRGALHPTWMFLGQGPGEDEDRQGQNFVGRTGQMLLGILRDSGFPLLKCRFENSVRCWSGPGNREPTPAEITACRPYLEAAIKRHKPKVVVVLGATALHMVLGKKGGITKMRGTVWKKDGVYYVATFHPSYLLYKRYNPEILEKFIADLATAKRIVKEGIPKPKDNYMETVMDYDEARDYIKHFMKLELPLDFDYETHGNKKTKKGYGPDPFAKDARCVMVSYSWDPHYAVSFVLHHPDAPYSKKKINLLIQAIKDMVLYRNKNGLKFGAYNAVFDMIFPNVAHGMPLPILDFDGYLAHHLIDEELKMPGLKQLMWHYTDLGGYDRELNAYCSTHPDADVSKGGSFENIPLDILGPYNCIDSIGNQRLREVLIPKMKEQGLMEVLETITLPASYVMLEYHKNGVRIDRKYAKKLATEYLSRLEALEDRTRALKVVKKYERIQVKGQREVFDLKVKQWEKDEKIRLKEGKRKRAHPKKPKFSFLYNPGSRDQNRYILFELLKLDSVEKTKTGMKAVTKEVLENLKGEHRIIPMLQDVAHIKKFYGTYVKPHSLNSSPEIFIPFYDLTGTVTGRCSSDFQQLPRKETNADIKKLFISRFGGDGCIMNSDVSQGEVRMFACASKDEWLIKAFNAGKDVHKMSAGWAYGIPEKDVTSEQRIEIKSAVTFGLLYGRSAEALAADLGWTVDQAQEFIDNYFARFAGVKALIDHYKDFLKEHGWIANLFGRRRRLPDARSHIESIKQRALRQGVNFPIQSTLHDLVLWYQCEINKHMKEYKLKSLMFGEAHDSIMMDIYKPELKTVAIIVKTVMENPPFDWINVPIVVDIEVGPNLLETKPYELVS